MGVHTLWDILAEAKVDTLKVTTLSGKRLAVDLSAWIVELKQSKASSEFHNAYIRNLFFRTIYFMREGVDLVFVIDGTAPELKQRALLSRQQNQFGSSSNTANPDRPFLKNAVSKCVEMLGHLGLPCLQSEGEAEALCAHLNSEGLVDGCLTEDNDFFLYGGKTLYRKLKKEHKTYFVDKFNIEKITDKLGLNRRDLVALALLLGSDYDDQKGVKCVGKEKGMALLEHLKSKNFDVLDRISGWRENKELDKLNTKLKHDTHCRICQHLGQGTIHKASGCNMCQTEQGCNGSSGITCWCEWHALETLRKENKIEISLRQKSLECEAFPNEKIVNEFLEPNKSDCKTIPKSVMNILKLIEFLKSVFRWSCDQVVEKIVPVMIHKQLRENRNQSDDMFTPVRILRTCKENHVECYEVVWDKTDRNDWAGTVFSTVEEKIEKGLFKSAYPKMVANYEMALAQKNPLKGKKRKSEVGNQLKMTDFTKIRKKLDFKEETACNTSGSRNDNISETSTVNLTDDERKLRRETAISKSVPDEIDSNTPDTFSSTSEKRTAIDLSESGIKTFEELGAKSNKELGESVKRVIGLTEGVKSDKEPGENAKTDTELGESAGEIKCVRIGQNAKSEHRSPDGKGKMIPQNVKRKSKKKNSDVSSSPSIISFLKKKDTLLDRKTIEFKQNDSQAFRVKNNSTTTNNTI